MAKATVLASVAVVVVAAAAVVVGLVGECPALLWPFAFVDSVTVVASSSSDWQLDAFAGAFHEDSERVLAVLQVP